MKGLAKVANMDTASEGEEKYLRLSKYVYRMGRCSLQIYINSANNIVVTVPDEIRDRV